MNPKILRRTSAEIIAVSLVPISEPHIPTALIKITALYGIRRLGILNMSDDIDARMKKIRFVPCAFS